METFKVIGLKCVGRHSWNFSPQFAKHSFVWPTIDSLKVMFIYKEINPIKHRWHLSKTQFFEITYYSLEIYLSLAETITKRSWWHERLDGNLLLVGSHQSKDRVASWPRSPHQDLWHVSEWVACQEFWSLFGGNHGQKFQKPTEIWENHVRFVGFENPTRIHSISNFAVLFLLKKIWRHLDGKFWKLQIYMVYPGYWFCTVKFEIRSTWKEKPAILDFAWFWRISLILTRYQGGGPVHSFLEIAVLGPWGFSKTGHSTPGKKQNRVSNPWAFFQNRTFSPWEFSKADIKPLATGQGPSMQSSERTRERCRRTGTGKS